jgi:Ca2+-binding EF-hand superfamily protein
MKASKILIAGTAIALLPFAAAVAQTPPADPAAQSRESTQPTAPAQTAQKGVTFESLDTDSDGRISKTEAAANSSVNAQFSRYDKNGDGFIEREEVNGSNTQPPAPPQQ